MLLVSIACQGPQESKEITEARAAYEANPSIETGEPYINALLAEVNSGDKDEINHRGDMMYKAVTVAHEQNMPKQQMALLQLFLRDFSTHEKAAEGGALMGESFKRMGKPMASQAVLLGLMEGHPESEAARDARSKVDTRWSDIDVLINELAIKIFDDSAKVVRRDIATAYVDAIEARALTMPADPETPVYLHKASEIAKTMGHNAKSINLYDWILTKYAYDTATAPQALFLKAQTLDDVLDREDQAKPLYELFIEKYPNHAFADDAQFQLETLGKSPDEVLQIIMGRAKAREAQGLQ